MGGTWSKLEWSLVVLYHSTYPSGRVLDVGGCLPGSVVEHVGVEALGLEQPMMWFRDLTEKNLRRGIFHNVPELIVSIESYTAVHNENPTPYVWTATAESILAKIQRARTALDNGSINSETDH